MQPYFLPYIGYFQLITACELFVVYDNIKYTKKGWINRNRMLRNGAEAMFSLPLQGAPDHLDIDQRVLEDSPGRHRWLAQLKGAYRHAPQFGVTLPLLERIAACDEVNLFRFLHNALLETCAHLGIDTPIRAASAVPADHGLKGQDRVLAICAALGARRYVNPIGGTELYSHTDFAQHGIDLRFLRARPLDYPQGGANAVPSLSIADVLMFNPLETVRGWVRTHYDLVQPQLT
ncbi:WbqC family protein [Massilia sp. H6]|uniref:WbqC family protein n=1 Tax=Massilia sp. H6 TaxID=2970464 RepID=UPI0021675899|nr:WbqC family protein [Massilia sp. H6]UVW29738.1 WbqC family protein [Massilia sp. H6]